MAGFSVYGKLLILLFSKLADGPVKKPASRGEPAPERFLA